MGVHQELENNILESYHIISEYQRTIQTSDRPEEKLRARRAIDAQWELIKTCLLDLLRVTGGALSPQMAEIAAHFPDLSSQYHVSTASTAQQIPPQPVTPNTPDHVPGRPPDKTTILFIAADPTDASRLHLGREFRELEEKLKLARLRDQFKLELPQLSARPADISQALLDKEPQIVHFSGHGTACGALWFENETGEKQDVQPDALAALFELFADRVNCVVLNACYSDIQAKAIAQHINYVIGMNKEIGDRAAIAFAVGFYQALGAGRTIQEAYKFGCVQIRLQGIPEHQTPVLVKKE